MKNLIVLALGISSVLLSSRVSFAQKKIVTSTNSSNHSHRTKHDVVSYDSTYEHIEEYLDTVSDKANMFQGFYLRGPERDWEKRRWREGPLFDRLNSLTRFPSPWRKKPSFT